MEATRVVMKKYKLVWTLSVVVVASLSGCCHNTQLNPVTIDGYQYAFPYPRTDVPPGTVIVIWDKPVKGKVDPVCRPADIGSPQLSKPEKSIEISEEEKSGLIAESKIRVKSALEAKLGGKRVIDITTTMKVTPVVLSDAYATVSRVASLSPVCKENAQWYKTGYKDKLDHFSLVTEAALVTFDHTVDLDADVGADAQTSEAVQTSTGVEAKLNLKWETDRKVHVTGDSVYTNYNVESASLQLP